VCKFLVAEDWGQRDKLPSRGRSRDMLDEAVQYASQSYQFAPNAYTYEALMRCTTVRDVVVKLSRAITDVSHFIDAFEQRGAA
jgi:hypothetical protein